MFYEGQRWMSEMEPELGLGIVTKVEPKRVNIFFPASDVIRLYSIETAPLKRVMFNIGDIIKDRNGKDHVINLISKVDELIIYHCGNEDIIESTIFDSMSFAKPEEKIFSGHYYSTKVFDLRYKTHVNRHNSLKSEVFGFIGPRIDLIPHQLYIAQEICNRKIPRVLLADEVGLGKTIEACLILHRLLITSRIQRIIILTLESLMHQWFVEMLRRFNIYVTIIDEKFCLSVENNSPSANPFLEKQLFICNIDYLSSNDKRFNQAISSKWDMVVVDEAHHLKADCKNYELVRQLSQKDNGLLLITATPDQSGFENHFERLKLLDPHRFHNYKDFVNETKNYKNISETINILNNPSQISRSKHNQILKIYSKLFNSMENLTISDLKSEYDNIIKTICDIHGTGRIVFRNTRKVFKNFPKRIVHIAKINSLNNSDYLSQLSLEFSHEINNEIYSLSYNDDPRIQWLIQLLDNNRDQKYLLICKSMDKAIKINNSIKNKMNINSAMFHENLSLVQRDKNAAWFCEKDGARILICSEIGSEGRNFQFVNNLILFDIPEEPQLLEQRIGRLDRIGQTKTINIYVPYIAGSVQEVFALWYHKALNAFEKNYPAGNEIFNKFNNQLIDLAINYHKLNEPELQLNNIIKESRKFSNKLLKEIEIGRDKLLELNSYNKSIAQSIVSKIEKNDNDNELDKYMAQLFDYFGIYLNEKGERSFELTSGNRFNEKFPGFREKMMITFSRKHAMIFENNTFLTWDHPMVFGAMELLTGSQDGTGSVAICETNIFNSFALETILILETVAPQNLNIERFLPPSPLRIIIDQSLNDCTDDFLLQKIELIDMMPESSLKILNKIKKHFIKILDEAKIIAEKKADIIINKCLKQTNQTMDFEIKRLVDLKKINKNILQKEIDLMIDEKQLICKYLSSARIRLDALRLIINSK